MMRYKRMASISRPVSADVSKVNWQHGQLHPHLDKLKGLMAKLGADSSPSLPI